MWHPPTGSLPQEDDPNRVRPGPATENPDEAILTPAQKQHLLDAARASRFFYTRETEPITLAAEVRNTRLFTSGRGLAIAFIRH